MSERQSGIETSAADVLAATRFGVVLVGRDGTVLWLNTEASVLLGWTTEQLAGLQFDETLHDRAHHGRCPIWDVGRTATAVDEADAFRRVDGTLMPVWWSSSLVARPGSTVEERPVAVSFLDVTERQVQAVAEAAAREQDRADLGTAQQSIVELGWIAELTRVMSTTMDEAEALLRLARLLTPRLADVVIVNQIDDEGRLIRLGGAAAPNLSLDLDEVLARPQLRHRFGGDNTTMSTIDSFTVLKLNRDQIRDPAVLGEPSRRLLEAVEAQSVLIIPLRARDLLVGVAAAIRSTSAAYTEADTLLAADVGRRAGLVVANARLYRREQRAAADLQRALLPLVEDTRGFGAAARYFPARHRLRVGGDWYDLFPCSDSESSVIAVIGDVAGHDLSAATRMAAVRNLLRGVAVTGNFGPAKVLEAVDRALAPLSIGGTATTLVARVDASADGWAVTFANAGHLPGLLVDANTTAVVELGTPPDPLLGTGSHLERRERTVVAPPGSKILFYTDGLIENRTESIDVGMTRLRQAVRNASGAASVDEFIDDVVSRMPGSADDDTAILALSLP